MILPINVDATATRKKIDIETTIPTIFTQNGKSNTTRYDEVFMFLYKKKNKKMKNLLTVASEEKQYINFDNN